MANTSSAKKRVRQNAKNRAHNASLRSMVRTTIKNVQKALVKGDAKEAAEAFKVAVPAIDRMVHKNMLHRNKAARHKSRLNAQIKALAEAAK